MDTLLPKVLVVGITAWRSDSSAHTLMDIFKCWDSQKLALVYTRSDLPSSDVAYRYFQISEGRVLKSITNWGIHTGREVEKSEEENESIIVEEHERYRKGRSRRSSILAVLREIVWLMGHWKSKELRSFLSDYNPDILFMPVYPVVYMGWLQRYIIRQTKRPFVCYLGDDNYSYASCKGFWSYFHRFWLRGQVRWLSTHCKEMFVIVDKEKEETDRLFGTNSVVLTKSIDFSTKKYEPHAINSPLKFVYTGKLIIGRDQTLSMIADAINEINLGGEKAVLDIYSPDVPNDEIMGRINCGASHYRGTIPRQEVEAVQQAADVVVFVESLIGKNSNAARLSFSTKITDYLSNGKCILAVGKDNIAPIEYLQHNDAAIVATSADQIVEKIKLIVENPSLVVSYGEKSYQCARKNHDKTVVDARFIETICKVLD